MLRILYFTYTYITKHGLNNNKYYLKIIHYSELKDKFSNKKEKRIWKSIELWRLIWKYVAL